MEHADPNPAGGLPQRRGGAAAIMRVAGGKITDSWIFADAFGLLLQLGTPDPLHPDRA
ncbi:hypothetical protein D3C83_21440 [compost metagenome]|jgi:hypothetical protein